MPSGCEHTLYRHEHCGRGITCLHHRRWRKCLVLRGFHEILLALGWLCEKQSRHEPWRNNYRRHNRSKIRRYIFCLGLLRRHDRHLQSSPSCLRLHLPYTFLHVPTGTRRRRFCSRSSTMLASFSFSPSPLSPSLLHASPVGSAPVGRRTALSRTRHLRVLLSMMIPFDNTILYMA